MHPLDFTRPPADPKQARDFVACQPSLARTPLLRQDNPDKAAVETFLGMVIDRSSKVFKIATCAAGVTAVLDVTATSGAVDPCEREAAPKLV
jgi:hypothetical protein